MRNGDSGPVIAGPGAAQVGLLPNHPEFLSQSVLGPGENVVFATRPSFTRGYWGRTLLLALVLLVLLLPAIEGDVAYVMNPAAWFLIALPVFFLLVVYMQWVHAVFALTNQRVVRVSGWRGGSVESVPILDVVSVNSGSSSGGDLLFRYRVPTTPGPANPAGYRVKTFTWPAVPNAAGTGARIQQMLQNAQSGLRVAQGQEQVSWRIAEDTVECAYCGGRVPLSRLSSDRPSCPFCSAPLQMPGT